MKYSLRSLMLLVTLICILIGGLLGRIAYLQRQAAFHEHEAERYAWQIEKSNIGWHHFPTSDDEMLRLHTTMATRYRKGATFQPWLIVDETLPPPEILRFTKPAPNESSPYRPGYDPADPFGQP